MNETIAAVATALGQGSVSIIRISGNESINIANKIFKGKNLKNVPTHTINYGYIMDENNLIDEVLVTVMRGPRSFTTEDVVEINCHGGIATTNKILELVLKNGARLAEPGEFSKRAFLNGRIDLVEAEGIMNLIEAKTDKMMNLAINQLGGNVSKLITNLREEIIKIISNIEVNIDYPEYEDIKVLTNEEILPDLLKIKNRLEQIMKESKNSKIIKEGISTAIIGKPNVGKSSLLNILTEEEKAIVTDIPGTTRDIVEGIINIDGILLNIIDTAGIRKTDDLVESIGVNKSYSYIDNAELILFVLNNNEQINKEELKIYEKVKTKNHLIIINKIDLEKKLDDNIFDENNIVRISTINNEGILMLKNKIKELFNIEKLEVENQTYLTNARSIALLSNSLDKINTAINEINKGTEIDIIEIDIKEAWEILGLIIGESYEDELIDNLFSKFCLGK